VKYKAIRGMEDILPRDIEVWQWLERVARRELEFYGYEEIRTPVLEDTSIFVRSIGETTDIVTKEMYSFKDRKGRPLTLRPEGTAPIVRAYIEHSLDKISPEVKLYYMGPMFRSERPQKGRSRQFHQIGVEVIGARSPLADAQVIMQMSKMLELFRLKNFTVKLNSLGCGNDKRKFADELKKYLEAEKKRLCKDCKERIKKNVLRVLDCKNESCAQIAAGAPDIANSMCVPCREHFDRVKNTLRAMKIKFEEVKNLVRGLDYYTGTVFEITHPALGGQDALGAGGRYDNLVKDFGGPDTGAIGYALGMERIIIALKDAKGLPGPVTIFVATMGEETKLKGEVVAEQIRHSLGRKEGMRIRVVTDTKSASLKSQMRSADKKSARVVVILGEDELKSQQATIRDMEKQEQKLVNLSSVVEEIKKQLDVITREHNDRSNPIV